MGTMASSLAALTLVSTVAVGAPLPIDGTWTPFDGNTTAFVLELPGPGEIRVVDGGTPGDRYLLTVLKGVAGFTFLQVATSDAETDPSLNVGSDYDAAFANTAFSAAVFELAAGAWEIQLGTLGSVPGEGMGAISVHVPVVPEPGAAAMMVVGALLTGATYLRRKRK